MGPGRYVFGISSHVVASVSINAVQEREMEISNHQTISVHVHSDQFEDEYGATISITNDEPRCNG